MSEPLTGSRLRQEGGCWGRPPAFWANAATLLAAVLCLAAWASTGGADDKPDARVDPDLLSGVEDRAPVRSADQNYYEARAYNYLLLHAHKLPANALAQDARRDLTYVHLFEEPQKYRGQVLHLEGRLRMLRRFDASALAAKEGVPVIYEGWLFTDTSYGNPYCVVTSAVEPPLVPPEKMDSRVVFDGYFFKRYRYKAGDGPRDAPLLIGKTLRLLTEPAPAAESPWSFNNLLLPTFLLLLLGTVLLGVGLGWWFRQGDRRVRQRLERLRGAEFGPTVEESADRP